MSAVAGSEVELRYQARAGLLPEITGQTYDTFPKALREALLNSLDAGAEHISLDFDRQDDSLLIADDGGGMSLADVENSFLSLGGSSKYGRTDQFGRIGIGSLALLHYAGETQITTRRAGTDHVVEVRLNHAWDLSSEARRDELSSFRAGHAWTRQPSESEPTSFTVIRLARLTPAGLEPWLDASAFFALVTQLERTVPLPWVSGAMLENLRRVDPRVADKIQQETTARQHRIEIRSGWGTHILKRRVFGDDPSLGEVLAGPVQAIDKSLVVYDGDRSRRISVFGCLAAQARALPRWSGLTARVQNVAVETGTFFGLESDPGFRRYVTGEIFIAGDVDTDHLINIDRDSFNSESADYQAIRRYLTRVLTEFKRQSVQAPQRRRVEIRRTVDARVNTLVQAKSVIERAASRWDIARLPSSNNGRQSRSEPMTWASCLEQCGAEVAWVDEAKWSIRATSESGRHVVLLPIWLKNPIATVGSYIYTVSLIDADDQRPPVVIRNRPRDVRLNVTHPSIQRSPDRAAVAVALEIAFVVAADKGASALYDGLLDLLAVT